MSLKQLHKLWATHRLNNYFFPTDRNGLEKHAAEEHLTWAQKNKPRLLSLSTGWMENVKLLRPYSS